jgi:DNA-binding response OmpR family regulator
VQRARRRWPLVGICCLGCTDVVAVLEAGADGAVPADAGPEVEAAQLAAAFRRARIASTELRVAFGDVVYDREARRVWCAGTEIMLTPRELRLFDILFVHAGAPVSVSTLQDYVWKDDFPRESNALAVYVSYLRRKLGASRLATLESVRGVGYRLARRG